MRKAVCRTLRELQGMQCIELDDAPEPKREIACTRSFGQAVTELLPLVEAVSELASRAAEKLRKQGNLARQLLVFCHTSPFRPGPRVPPHGSLPSIPLLKQRPAIQSVRT